MAYGITPTGFVIKTFEILLAEVIEDIKSNVGVAPVGALLKILAAVVERISEVWEVLELSYTAIDVDTNTDDAQDATAAISGAERNGATASSVTLSFTGTPGTVIAEGSRAKHAVTSVMFRTMADVTILASTAWVANTVYALGDRRYNGATSRVYVVTTGGTAAASGGPTTTADVIADGPDTLVWRYIGDGTGVVDGLAEATVTGPFQADSGTITVKDTPVIGWSSVRNLLDADVGRNLESAGDFRVRRALELSQAGSGTTAAIRAAVLEIKEPLLVTSATVFHNPTDDVDADGMPPHSVEVLVRGGEAEAIAKAIRANVDAGIATVGTELVILTDSEGFEVEYRFSRPVEVITYVDVTLVVDPTVYAADGDTLTENALVVYGDAQAAGKNVVAQRLEAVCNPGIAGVLEATCLISKAPTTTPIARTTIAIARRELAVFDTSRITITTSNGTP